MEKSNKGGQYTCNEYREEMILLGLQKRLSSKGLTQKEKESLLKDIAKVEKQMGID
ncbi:MAG: hypothetical protein H8D87_19725 [Deltaproteobacteria bacterium]|uniref:hypothetical protein n=1 Tax=Desulfobacula sp. TaxID=2593537 RepID=UPI0019C86096|nr:hypothetical protein [Candidatus Desulfobacula maris]MBL6995919.1 hypothetical protein [Desulfobacula sp.]